MTHHDCDNLDGAAVEVFTLILLLSKLRVRSDSLFASDQHWVKRTASLARPSKMRWSDVMRLIVIVGIVAIAAPGQAASYSPSEQEQRMLRRLVDDEVEVWLANGDKLLDYAEWPMVVRAEKLVDAYSDNEVAADMAFKGKRVLVTAAVEAIRKDAADQPYLSLSSGTGAALRSLHASFPQSRKEELARLKKQQRVTVSCVVRGLFLNQPVLNDCSLFDSKQVRDQVMTTVEAALRGERELNEHFGMAVVFGITIARAVKADSPCLTKPLSRNKQCDAELRQMKKGAIEAVRDELLRAGLKWAGFSMNNGPPDAGR